LPSGLSKVQYGGGQHGFWNSTINRHTWWASALSQSDLVELSKQGPTFFDDFDQVDGALISPAPTGQSCVQIQPTAAGIADVLNKKLRGNYASSGPTAAYTAIPLFQMPVLATARIDFTSGSSGGAAAIVANPRA